MQNEQIDIPLRSIIVVVGLGRRFPDYLSKESNLSSSRRVKHIAIVTEKVLTLAESTAVSLITLIYPKKAPSRSFIHTKTTNWPSILLAFSIEFC